MRGAHPAFCALEPGVHHLVQLHLVHEHNPIYSTTATSFAQPRISHYNPRSSLCSCGRGELEERGEEEGQEERDGRKKEGEREGKTDGSTCLDNRFKRRLCIA